MWFLFIKHLTPENEQFIDSKRIARMKDGVILVNTSRGRIIDEQALLAALESGKVGAAGLDVIDGEWRRDLEQHALIQYARDHDNLVIVPHLGGITWESQATVLYFVADKVAEILAVRAV